MDGKSCSGEASGEGTGPGGVCVLQELCLLACMPSLPLQAFSPLCCVPLPLPLTQVTNSPPSSVLPLPCCSEPLSGSPREPGPTLPRPGSADGQPPQMREPQGGPPLLSEGLDLETWGSSSGPRKTKEGRRKDREKQRERKKEGYGRPPHQQGPPEEEEEEDRARRHPHWSQDKTQGPRLLVWDAEPPRAGRGGRDPKRPQSQERPPRTPPPPTDREEEWRSGHRSRGPRGQGERGPTPNGRERQAERRYGQSQSPNPDRRGLPPQEDRSSPRPPAHHHARQQDLEAAHRHQPRREDGEREARGARASPTAHRREGKDGEARRPRNPGNGAAAHGSLGFILGLSPLGQKGASCQESSTLQEERNLLKLPVWRKVGLSLSFFLRNSSL